jgi:hypothetical protein
MLGIRAWSVRTALARLAGRADVTAGDFAVGELVALCGYLPLAVKMAGRQLAHHPAWSAADLAHELAVAKDRLELMAAENLTALRDVERRTGEAVRRRATTCTSAGGRRLLPGSFGSMRVHARCLMRSDLAGLAFAGATA